MFEIGRASVRAITAGATVVVLAACGGAVDSAATDTGGGGSTSSGASGGGAGGLPAPTCAPGEAAIMIATGVEHAVIAVAHDGAWAQAPAVLPAPAFPVTYVDVYHHLGVFWIDTDSAHQSHFATTSDGTSFDVHDVHGWAPKPWDPFAAVTTDVLLGADADGASLARFDPDAFDWYPYLATNAIKVTSAAPLGSTGDILAVGLGPDLELCDIAAQAGAWGSVHCREDIHPAVVDGDFNVMPPQAVALPDGDVVVVYFRHPNEGGVTLAATTLHAGAWSAPDYVTSMKADGIVFAATATPSGDVIVGVVNTGSALRYTPGAGWGAPISLAPHSGGYAMSAAPGICGDDALIAFSGSDMGHGVRVARVRGDVAEALTIDDFIEDPSQVSISTRPASAL